MSCDCCGGDGDEDREAAALQKVLAEYRERPGALIPVLQEAQNIYGYLPPRVMQEIAGELKMPFARVFGVATFYAQFHFKPRGRNVVRVCQGTACHVRGGERIYEAVAKELGVGKGDSTEDGRYTFETVACLGCCGLAPVVMVNEDTFGRLTPGAMGQILSKYE
ncbi:MAG TPA: NADH-quinone oxidoreductase subunit NuoE [Spirochaetia bacterium]|nr:NADH-quinone oxidoreductase subunit NuoE [Spirochaetia bacterium]